MIDRSVWSDGSEAMALALERIADGLNWSHLALLLDPKEVAQLHRIERIARHFRELRLKKKRA